MIFKLSMQYSHVIKETNFHLPTISVQLLIRSRLRHFWMPMTCSTIVKPKVKSTNLRNRRKCNFMLVLTGTNRFQVAVANLIAWGRRHWSSLSPDNYSFRSRSQSLSTVILCSSTQWPLHPIWPTNYGRTGMRAWLKSNPPDLISSHQKVTWFTTWNLNYKLY